jgi:hypothetical protein
MTITVTDSAIAFPGGVGVTSKTQPNAITNFNMVNTQEIITNLPADVKRITVNFNRLLITASNPSDGSDEAPVIQLGTASGYITSGYLGCLSFVDGGSSNLANFRSINYGFYTTNDNDNRQWWITGTCNLTKIDNLWVATIFSSRNRQQGNIDGTPNDRGRRCIYSVGHINLGASPLTRIRLVSINMDNGSQNRFFRSNVNTVNEQQGGWVNSVNVLYEV